MRFDGYGATIRTETPREIVACLADALNTKPEAGPAVRRFGVTTGFNVGPRLAVWMGIDPNPETDICYIEAKGETTPQVVEAIRRSFPVHSAPRLDVCEDYDEPGAFDALQALVRATKGPKVKGGYVALPDDEKDGKTWSAGTRGGVDTCASMRLENTLTGSTWAVRTGHARSLRHARTTRKTRRQRPPCRRSMYGVCAPGRTAWVSVSPAARSTGSSQRSGSTATTKPRFTWLVCSGATWKKCSATAKIFIAPAQTSGKPTTGQ